MRQAEGVLAEARRAAAALQDERLAAHALVRQLLLRLQITTDATVEAAAATEEVLPVFERHRDELGACHARRLEAWVHWIRGNVGAAEAAWQEAAEHARRAGAAREEADVLLWLASAALAGPTPAREGVVRCEELLARMADRPTIAAPVLNSLAGLQAMLGRFDEARRLLARAGALFTDFAIVLGAKSHPEALVAMLADDLEEAERCLRADYDYFASRGEKGFLSTTAALLARAVEAQGRHEEARELTEVAERSGASDDFATQIVWRGVRARVLAEDGDRATAERLAREAVTLAGQTDRLNYHGDALVDLAAVLRRSKRADGEREALAAALALYERKGNVVASARVRSRLDEL
jgi:tetratricopeptide (TPR) repeat protein